MTQGFSEKKDPLTNQRTAHVNNANKNKNKTPQSKVSISPANNLLTLSLKNYGDYGYTVNELEFVKSWVTGIIEPPTKKINTKLSKLINYNGSEVSVELTPQEIQYLKKVEPVFNNIKFLGEAMDTELTRHTDYESLVESIAKSIPNKERAKSERTNVILDIKQSFKPIIKNLNAKIQKLSSSPKKPSSPKSKNAVKILNDIFDKSDDVEDMIVKNGIWDLAGINYIDLDASKELKERFITENPKFKDYVVVVTYAVDTVFILSKYPKKFKGTAKGHPRQENIRYGIAGMNMILENVPSRILIVGQND